MRTGWVVTTTSATALPSPPWTVCSSTVTIGPRLAASAIASRSIGRMVERFITAASMLAAFNIEKAIGDNGEMIEPNSDFLQAFVRLVL